MFLVDKYYNEYNDILCNDTILDKILSFGNPSDNSKIILMVFNNSTKQFQRYNLIEDDVLRALFSDNEAIVNQFIMDKNVNKSIILSSLIQLVLSYRYERVGLDSLYVYDTSCSDFMNPTLTTRELNELEQIIEDLPINIGR
jgi:hypothetical protein